jgi:hypothetical protein
MITAGDIQFQPPVRKIWQLTTSIFALTAGDASANAEILTHTLTAVRRRLALDNSWMRLSEVADIVSSEVVSYRKRVAERTVLAPIGLTFETFISRQREMALDWATRITERVMGVESGTHILVAGVDEGGAHIWLVDGMGKAFCNDTVGFAAIGFGQWHAESQFMFAGHANWKTLPETILLSYLAKKRAEVAPGVGTETDMCAVSGLGNFLYVHPQLQGYLDGLHQKVREHQEHASDAAKVVIAKHFELAKKGQQTAQSTQERPSPAEPVESSTTPTATSPHDHESVSTDDGLVVKPPVDNGDDNAAAAEPISVP